jgi:hypothetical protein
LKINRPYVAWQMPLALALEINTNSIEKEENK